MNQKSCSEFSLAPKTQKTKKKLSHEKNLSKKGWYKVKQKNILHVIMNKSFVREKS